MDDDALGTPFRSKTSLDEDTSLYAIPAKQDHSKSYTKLIIVSIMCLVFITGEIVGGIISHSISVISDATHLITDFIGFILSFVFLYYSSKNPDEQKSFGFHRLEIIGAIANLFIIWAVAFFLIIESTSRIVNKEFVQEPKIMLIVAGGGLLVNIGMYFVLHSGGGHSHGLGQECSHSHSAPAAIPSAIAEQPEFEVMQEEMDTEINKSAIKGEDKAAEQHNHQNCNHDPQHQHAHHHHDTDSIPDEAKTDTHRVAHKHSHNAHPHPHDHLHSRKDSHCHTHDHDHGVTHHQHNSSGSHQSISMKAAVLHALTDIIQSIGLLTAAILIFFFGSDHGQTVTEFNGWHYLDPITTYVFSVLVLYSTWPITKLCFNIILEATPEDIKPDEIKDNFKRCEGVMDVHDFHVWQLKPGKLVLTAHVTSDKGKEIHVLRRLTKICRRKKIYHSTIQIEHSELRGTKGYIICENDID